MSDTAETTTATTTETARAIAEATDTRASCANCGAPLHGRFCAQCGQEDKPLDPPVRHFATAFAQELLDVDGRVPRSFRRLFFSPGFLTSEYLAGRRVPWLTPLRLYLIASVAMFGVLAAAGDSGGVQLTFTGDSADVAERLRSMGYASEAELRAAIDHARYTWMPRVMFVLVPLFAWLVSLVRRNAGRRFPAHFVFALEVHAAAFGSRAIAKALAALAPSMVAADWRRRPSSTSSVTSSWRCERSTAARPGERPGTRRSSLSSTWPP